MAEYFNAHCPHDSANVRCCYRNSQAQSNPPKDITSLRAARREDIPLEDKQGIAVP